MSTPPRRPDLFSLWGTVQRAVHDPQLRQRPGGVVQNIFESYKQGYLEAGQAPPPLSIFEVNQLRSLASAQYRAEANLGAAIASFRRDGIDVALTYDHSAPDLDARPGAGYAAPRMTRVRFEFNATVDGVSTSQIRTLEMGLDAPQSVSDLLQLVDQAGQTLADSYGMEYDGPGSFVSVTWL